MLKIGYIDDLKGLPSLKNTDSGIIETPIGAIELIANSDALIAINLNVARVTDPRANFNGNKILLQAEDELEKYFMGELTLFKVPINIKGTNFQMAVWKEILNIPYGSRSSYSEVAKSIGCFNSARAIGQANSKNFLPIIIPCHRVTLSNGKIGGYSAGVKNKKWLLELEDSIR